MDTFRLLPEDVTDFSVASGDMNPLHVDPAFARRTPFGRPIAHGVLSLIAALAAVPAQRLSAANQLIAQFSRPVLPGLTYRVHTEHKRDGGVLLVAREGDMPVLTASLQPGLPLVHAALPADRELPGIPETCELSDRTRGRRFDGAYGIASMEGLRRLAEGLGAAAIPDALLGALAWGSWFVGMRFPGRDALFSGLRIRAGRYENGRSLDPLRYRADVKSVDLRTGTVLVEAGCADLEMEMRACHRPPVPRPTWSSATGLLPRGEHLTGSNALVIGGGRGLGAAITSVLVAQGATVWATQRSPGSVEELQREFGPERVKPLLLDATDAGQVRTAGARIEASGMRLDGIVLCAGPSVMPLTVHPDNVGTIKGFVDTSLTMALTPLSEMLGRLASDGWMAVISSSSVEDMPEQWPHYAIAKTAVEALGHYCAHRRGLKVLIARPPKMWTEMSNGPLGRVGAIPTEQVASAIVDWAIRRDEHGPVTVLGSRALASWTPDPVPAPSDTLIQREHTNTVSDNRRAGRP